MTTTQLAEETTGRAHMLQVAIVIATTTCSMTTPTHNVMQAKLPSSETAETCPIHKQASTAVLRGALLVAWPYKKLCMVPERLADPSRRNFQFPLCMQ